MTRFQVKAIQNRIYGHQRHRLWHRGRRQGLRHRPLHQCHLLVVEMIFSWNILFFHFIQDHLQVPQYSSAGP